MNRSSLPTGFHVTFWPDGPPVTTVNENNVMSGLLVQKQCNSLVCYTVDGAQWFEPGLTGMQRD